LSGSKILILVLIVSILSSCGIFVQEKRYKRPKTTHKPNKKADPIKKDTFEIENDQVVKIPEIKEEDLYEKYGSEFKNQYKIGVILPLKGKNHPEDLASLQEDVSYRFVNYYGGLLLALEDLENSKVGFDVEIINSSMSKNDGYLLMNQLNRLNLDLIIGPYDRELLKEVARYGKRKDIPVISPWQSSSKITEDNPNYVQLKPDIKTFFNAIVEHTDKHFSADQVYLVGREFNRQEASRISYFQEVHFSNDAGPSSKKSTPYNVFYVVEDSLSMGETAFDSLFFEQKNKEIAVIIPNWSYRDEQFIYSCMRKLNAEKLDVHVVVYGMPIMVETDKIGFNLYKNLNLRVALESYIDKSNYRVIDFREKYYNKYGAIPNIDAFSGYDVMSYLGTNLINHGTKFQYFLPDVEQEFLHTSYDIKSVISDENLKKEIYDQIDYYENVHINIMGFEYNAFQIMD